MRYCDQTLMWQTNPLALVKMFYKKNNSRAGSEKQYGPRLVGDILSEMLRSDSPLAKGYRKYLAFNENRAEKGGKS